MVLSVEGVPPLHWGAPRPLLDRQQRRDEQGNPGKGSCQGPAAAGGDASGGVVCSEDRGGGEGGLLPHWSHRCSRLESG